jgi:hypothetical protein
MGLRPGSGTWTRTKRCAAFVTGADPVQVESASEGGSGFAMCIVARG